MVAAVSKLPACRPDQSCENASSCGIFSKSTHNHVPEEIVDLLIDMAHRLELDPNSCLLRERSLVLAAHFSGSIGGWNVTAPASRAPSPASPTQQRCVP